jgi:hypothetical protein
MGMGAPEPSQLAEMALRKNTTAVRVGGLALPYSPVPPSPRPNALAPPTSDLPHSTPPPTASSARNVSAASKGKQREEPQGSDAAMDATGAPVQPGIHRYAPFTLERCKKVTGMVQEFFGALDAYAKEENLDLTAVTRCFTQHLTTMRLSPWQAIQRLLSIQRNGGSKCLDIAALFVWADRRVSEVDFDSLLNAAAGAGPSAIQDEETEEVEDSDEYEGSDESCLPSASPSSATVDKAKYQELLAKARKYPGGEKRLKQAIVQYASDRMEEYIHVGATDNRRVRAIRDSHAELTQYVKSL